MSKYAEKIARSVVVKEELRSLERKCISISAQERAIMHQLNAEKKQLFQDISWIETELAIQQWNAPFYEYTVTYEGFDGEQTVHCLNKEVAFNKMLELSEFVDITNIRVEAN